MPILVLIISLILNFLVAFLLTKFFQSLALKFNILDSPASAPNRKNHKQPIPLLGGFGFIISSSFFTGILWLLVKANHIGYNWPNWFLEIIQPLGNNLEPFKIIWVFVAILILLIAGFLDDKFQFSSKIMILPITLAILVVIFFGDIKIEGLSYPFDQKLNIYTQYFLTFIWLLLCISATKFLDGLDGLVASLGIIGLVSIGITSLLPQVSQPFIFVFCLIWTSGILGFLPYNLPDAKLYLGEAGSVTIGFIIGILAILSGAKVATASSVVGWFIYDISFVMILRILQKKNPLVGDRQHWHFRLQDLGLSKTQTLLITNFIVIISAFLGITLPTSQKIYLLIFQAIILLSIFVITIYLKKKYRHN
jgi:UDP-GlcNAc:undecaprenyl-phosphate/decaprenyl-phosphate GlcNAc-1-phosphate transferase